MASQALSRRERKRIELHDQLYLAAVELFVERGFDATTMDDIADRADVARATVFNHFPQKLTFLEEWGRRRRARVRDVFVAEHIEDVTASAQLRRYFAVMADQNTGSRAATMTLMTASVRAGEALWDPAVSAPVAEMVERGRGSGEFRSDVDAGQAAALLVAGYFNAVLRWIAVDPAPFELDAYLDRMLDMVFQGLT
ncbi:MAG TPA: TetR/AcrR family transcriptional regulator [Pseudonocardiaceae bacterium]